MEDNRWTTITLRKCAKKNVSYVTHLIEKDGKFVERRTTFSALLLSMGELTDDMVLNHGIKIHCTDHTYLVPVYNATFGKCFWRTYTKRRK